MDIDRMNIYTRLRDQFIPSTVLDEIFDKNVSFSIQNLHFIKIEIFAHDNFISINQTSKHQQIILRKEF